MDHGGRQIRQEGQDVMNRDEGTFLLCHVYDDLLLSTATTAETPSGESAATTAETPSGESAATTAETPSGESTATTAETPSGESAATTAETPSGESSVRKRQQLLQNITLLGK